MVNGGASEAKTAAFRARVAGDRPDEKLSPLTELLQQKGAGEKQINKQLLGLRGKRRVEKKNRRAIYIRWGCMI